MLTKRMQVDILATMLSGMNAPPGTRIVDFDGSWRTVYQAIKDTTPDQRVNAMREALVGDIDQQGIISQLMSSTNLRSASVYRSLAEVAGELPPIAWSWRNWIPRGMISMMAAAGGTGKSLVTLDLCRRVMTAGENWPDGQPIMQHGPVIYIDAEGVPQLHNSRTQDWGMDTSRLYLLPDPLQASVESVDLSSEEWRDRLIEMTFAIRPQLVVIDSLGDVNSRGENNVEDVRELLNWLGRFVLDFQIALVIIHHIRKRGSTAMFDLLSQDDVRGSGHIVNKARSVIGLSKIKDGDENGAGNWRRMEVIKTNLCKEPEPIGVEFLPGLNETPVLRYGNAPVTPKAASENELCQEWLLELLGAGPMNPAEIIDEGKAQGYSRSLIYKARAVLGKKIHNTAGAKSPANQWELNRI